MELVQKKVKSIVEKIRVARETKGYTQDYLAAKLSISQNAYSKLELGYSTLTVVRLFAIALILEIDARELLSGTNDEVVAPAVIHSKAMELERYIAAL
ncbi:helix-turn-helix transcriptional regulator [Mucilaginibacter sp. CAU 1740]|uniref:helix-turn-helix domain-containing protein n=1 Tax=Mucilaginibacter sp. CAU 1740 TaxID=3140365 RepID=UPI00325B7E3F